MATTLTLSVIIPVAPGESAWQELLGDLATLPDDAEILLVAARGEAPQEWPAVAHHFAVPVRWLEAPAGRARQQNAGAAAARGENLWFLHADSRLPAGTVAAAWKFAGRRALGYGSLQFAADGPRLAQLNALGARLRSRWLGLPFGDQGFILPRALFVSLGGFDETLAAGEDHALVWRARHAGVPLVPLGAPVISSARRYAEHGWLRTTLRHARLTLAQARRFARRP